MKIVDVFYVDVNGVIYNDTCGNVYTLVRAVVGTKNNTTASLYNGYKKTVPKKVTAFNDAMKDLQTK